MASSDYNGLIAQAASKGKFLEFVDGMVPAFERHYAMIQGAIGTEYATNSGIRMVITDYSDKNSSQVANVLVPTYVFSDIEEICRKNTGTMVITGGRAVDAYNSIRNTHTGMSFLVNKLKTGLGTIITGKEKEPLMPIGSALKIADKIFRGIDPTNNELPAETIEILTATNWHWDMTRVIPAKPNPNGKVPCKMASIAREEFGKGVNGQTEKNKLPWFITVSNFDAMPKEHQNGTVSYLPQTVENKVELSFRLNDDTMMRCVYAVQHFVSQWERANLGPFINGMNERHSRAEQYKSSRI